MTKQRLGALLMTLGAVATVGILYVGMSGSPEAAPRVTLSPSPTASQVAAASGPAATPTQSPTASPLPEGTFENEILGYRITLPDGYRRSIARLITASEHLGDDYYTAQTEQQEREMCMSDSGDVGFPGMARDRDPDIDISVSRNPKGLSAVEWVTTPGESGHAYSQHQKVEATTVGGHEAARLVTDNAAAETSAFVIRANDRIYLIHMPFGGLREGLPRTWLDEIARTFEAIPPAPFPAPTATTPPRQAAGELARTLAAAFSARDAGAVARLMPECWLNVIPVTTDGTGVLYRSVSQFRDALRERFAAGDLAVTVDTAVQEAPQEDGMFFVRSEWKESDRTSHVDMYLVEREGRWHWFIAAHHEGWPCRGPWVAESSC